MKAYFGGKRVYIHMLPADHSCGRELRRVGARGRSKLRVEVLWELLAQPPDVACGGAPFQ